MTTMNDSISKIETLPHELSVLVADLGDEELDTAYREGGWTIRQVVHHLADSHMNGFIRMRLILTEKHPTLKPYIQDSWALLPDTAMPIEPSLAILVALHSRWAHMLRALPDKVWSRTAFHPEIGDVTLGTLAESYAAHGRKHLDHIRHGLVRAKERSAV
jgi:hypothetical protein